MKANEGEKMKATKGMTKNAVKTGIELAAAQRASRAMTAATVSALRRAGIKHPILDHEEARKILALLIPGSILLLMEHRPEMLPNAKAVISLCERVTTAASMDCSSVLLDHWLGTLKEAAAAGLLAASESDS